jgi:hypothetical protein
MEERTYVSVYIIKLKLTKDKQDQLQFDNGLVKN